MTRHRLGSLAKPLYADAPPLRALDPAHPLDRARMSVLDLAASDEPIPAPPPDPSPVYRFEGEAYAYAIAELRRASWPPYRRDEFEPVVLKHLRFIADAHTRDRALARWLAAAARKKRFGTKGGFALLERLRGGWSA